MLSSVSTKIRILIVGILALVSSLGMALKLGDMLISPTRLTLDEKNRGGSIVVVNTSQNTVRYRLNLVDMNMSPEGVIKKSGEPTHNSAINFLRFSPREITLSPGTSQKIRILSVIPLNFPDGEMRSHLEFEPIGRPNTTTKSSDEGQNVVSTNINVRLVVTIPIIVRVGNVFSTALMSDGSIEQKGSAVKVSIHREGNSSIRGDMFVHFKPANGGKSVLVGVSRGVAVYYPNPTRSILIGLQKNLSSLGEGDVEVQFVESDKRKNSASKLFVIHSR